MKRFLEKSPSWLVAFAVAASTVAALAHVWVRLQMLSIGYDISRETKWRHDLGEQNQRLTLELRTRMDLAVVERIARDELKMVPPDPRMIRVVQMSERSERSRSIGSAARGAAGHERSE